MKRRVAKRKLFARYFEFKPYLKRGAWKTTFYRGSSKATDGVFWPYSQALSFNDPRSRRKK